MKKLKKPSKRKPRDWHSVNAHFRNSAGPMKDKKKEESKRKCRNKIKDEIAP